MKKAGTFIFVGILLIFSSTGCRSKPGSDGMSTINTASPYDETRFARFIRKAGQDSCNTYRIPGLVTTKKGTLIAVFDNRYNSSKDLQEDIDIGMCRSTDGGDTWEPMRVILDMGEYGGYPQSWNGTGDPCVLYDPNNSTLYVAALWMTGLPPDKTLWWASGTGLKPEETGQILLVKSTDDGLTWPQEYQLKIDSGTGYGYSCLTMVNDTTVGILYEGIGDLIFQKVPVNEIFKQK